MGVFTSDLWRHREVQLFCTSKVPYHFNNYDLIALIIVDIRNYLVKEKCFLNKNPLLNYIPCCEFPFY